jgi:hypothetical protein
METKKNNEIKTVRDAIRIKNVIRVIKYIRGKSFKEIKEEFKYKFFVEEWTAEKMLNVQIVSYKGTILGTIFAMIFLIAGGLWYISIAILFSLGLQYAGLKGALQQRNQLKNLRKLAEDIQNNQEVQE